jgi:hypothetical protein
MKRYAIDWEKIFANHMSGKELIFRIYEELSILHNKKKKKKKKKPKGHWELFF